MAAPEKKKLSEKFAGKLPENIADDMQKYITESREEWEHHKGLKAVNHWEK